MLEDKIKKLLEEGIPEDVEVTAFGLMEFADIELNILKTYTNKIVDNLNIMINKPVKEKVISEDIAKKLGELFSTMLSKSIDDALDYIFDRLPDFITNKKHDDMSECDGTA